MKIKILSKDLINKIAAGEVVERPASVVKELVENAIDAGSRQIIIEVKNGGIDLIQVTDDGSGMVREDAILSIKEHATSKLASQDDLFKIGTLGFRGEALSSISSVSDFTLVTKDEQSLSATKLILKNNVLEISQAGAPRGTCVTVENLFVNVPARRKFLKTPLTEFNAIADLFFNFCLSYPQIAWKLVNNDRVAYQFPASESFVRVADVLGSDIANHLISIDVKLNDIYLSGFIGKPQIARSNHKLQYLFINSRPVNDYVLNKQVKDAYATLLPKELYPVFILNLQMPLEKVDVNVHPRKMEVRFSNPAEIYRTVYSVVSRILDENDLKVQVAAVKVSEPFAIAEVFKAKNTGQTFNFSKLPAVSFVDKKNDKINALSFSQKILAAEAPAEVISQQEKFKIIGQISNSYIVVEAPSGLRIYDQHATSERVRYEKIKKDYLSGAVVSQKMLLPFNIELAGNEASLLRDNLLFFNNLGFEINELSGNTFSVSCLPKLLVESDARDIVVALIKELDENIDYNAKIVESVDKILKLMACKSAIKFGDSLSFEGMKALILDLESSKSQYTCVHGRPCVIEYSFVELEKMFKRVV